MVDKMPKKSIQQWTEMFKALDKDDSGWLDENEIRDMLRANNCKVSEAQIQETFVYFDGPKGDKRITLEEFIIGMNKFGEFVKQLRDMFRQADTDCSGYLEKNELRKLLCACGAKFKDFEIDRILKEADTSGDGRISFEEFLEACT